MARSSKKSQHAPSKGKQLEIPAVAHSSTLLPFLLLWLGGILLFLLLLFLFGLDAFWSFLIVIILMAIGNFILRFALQSSLNITPLTLTEKGVKSVAASVSWQEVKLKEVGIFTPAGRYLPMSTTVVQLQLFLPQGRFVVGQMNRVVGSSSDPEEWRLSPHYGKIREFSLSHGATLLPPRAKKFVDMAAEARAAGKVQLLTRWPAESPTRSTEVRQ